MDFWYLRISFIATCLAGAVAMGPHHASYSFRGSGLARCLGGGVPTGNLVAASCLMRAMGREWNEC